MRQTSQKNVTSAGRTQVILSQKEQGLSVFSMQLHQNWLKAFMRSGLIQYLDSLHLDSLQKLMPDKSVNYFYSTRLMPQQIK